MSNVECSKNYPGFPFLIQMCRIFGLSLEFLFALAVDIPNLTVEERTLVSNFADLMRRKGLRQMPKQYKDHRKRQPKGTSERFQKRQALEGRVANLEQRMDTVETRVTKIEANDAVKRLK
jgi:hypothetical protein